MLKLNTNKKSFETLVQSELKAENILERYDFQSAIAKSWETVKSEIGLPTSYLIGEEISPHLSVGNMIDLLAFDPEDSSLYVIELKRDKNKLQLLQSLSYAAMVATWDKETLITKIQTSINPEPDELIEIIRNNDLNTNVKVILISELYDPEVIITADWLNNNYGLDITALAVKIHKLEDQLFVNFEQRLPLKELTDVYEVRGRRSIQSASVSTVTWEDVLPKLKYDFAPEALRLCKDEKDGEPSRRRFGRIRTNYNGFNWITINFRSDYLNVYIKGKPENAEELIRSKFSSQIEINQWELGYSFNLKKQSQFTELVNWLKLGKN